ncbi:MAG TPA: TetR/AcrR family transcriptional regulator [Solirubrobacterales bacterium]|nr:TetR/AcrR family transcriptional regulator [Solirubrobacterales bacterium]
MQYLSQRLATKPSPRRGRAVETGPASPPQRERILDAVELLVSEQGIAGTAIEAIVKQAGVSSVTFYEYFEGKEECFLAAYDRAVDAATGALAKAAAGDPAAGGLSWSEQIATGLRTLTGLIAAWPERAHLCLVEAQTGGPELALRFETTLDRVAAKLREGRALRTAPADLPATHEEATAGALAWLLRERLEAGDAEGLEKLYPELIDIALAPYLGDG